MVGRRNAFGFALAAAFSFFVGAAGPSRAETIELKLSHFLPPNHTLHKVVEAWAAQVSERSGGRLAIKIFPASQLGPVQRQFDLARSGQADLAIGLVGATPGRYPLTELSNLPFVRPKAGSSSAVMSERLTELAPKYLAGEFGFEACHTAMLTLGGMGYAQEYHVERYLREVLIPRTAPVSPHMILNFLAEKVLGLPKSY